MSSRPALVLPFLATDPGLSARSVGVWAEAAFAAKAVFDGVTIAVVDTAAGGLPCAETELQMVCQSSSVQFRHLRSGSGTLADVASQLCRTPDDVLLVAAAADVPSPWLLERMLARLTGSGVAGSGVAVVDAHPLPVAPPHQWDDCSAPAGMCVLLSGGTCAELADFEMSSPDADVGRILEAAARAGATVATDRRATVFRDRRVAPDGEPSAPGIRELGDLADLGAVPAGAVDSHPATLAGTSLGEVLRATGVQPRVGAGAGPASCFLTVLTRTQGLRPQCLEEMLLCLAAQTVRDFEVVLACHQVAEPERRQTAELVAGFPAWLRDRVRIVDVDRPGRAAPLNDALDAANGRYVVILDDDDVVLAHWVETFLRLEQQAPGRMLRTAALRQDVVIAAAGGLLAATPVGRPWCDWPLSFELVDHLGANATPCLSVAFPRGVYADLGLRFDEGMLAIEDWDYLVRSATIVGVESCEEPTSVYRWWLDGESSRTVQTRDDWIEARTRAHATIDSRVILLPQGSARRIRSLFEENRRAWAEVKKANAAHELTNARLAEVLAAEQLALGRADAAEARVEDLRTRLRRQRRRVNRLRRRLEESAGPRRGILERLAARGVRAAGR